MVQCDLYIDGELINSLFNFIEIPRKGEYIYLEGYGEFKVSKVRRYFRESKGRFKWFPDEKAPDVFLTTK